MKKNIKQKDLHKVFSAFEEVLRNLKMDHLQLKNFTLIDNPVSLEEAELSSDASVNKSPLRKDNKAFFRRGHKCYERICTEHPNGEITCTTKEVDCP